MGNMARSAGGENLWCRMGSAGGAGAENGGSEGAENWGSAASRRILSARARLYSWEKLRAAPGVWGESEGGRLGLGGDTETEDTGGNREKGSEAREAGEWAGGQEEREERGVRETGTGDSALGMFS